MKFKLKFEAGIVKIQTLKLFFFPTNYWAHFFENIEKKLKSDQANELLFKSGIQDGKRLGSLKFEEFLNCINSLGIGKVEAKKINNNIIQLKINEKITSKINSILNIKTNLNIENIQLGMIKGYFEFNNKSCKFELIKKPSKLKIYILNLSTYEISKSKTIKPYQFNNNSFLTQQFLKNIILKGNLVQKDTELFLFKMPE